MAKPGYWATMRHLWSLQGEPLRPPAEAVDRMVAETGSCEEPILLLGVTPEFYKRYSRIIAIDKSKAMVDHVWPGDRTGKRAIVGRWQSEIQRNGKFVAILGDGSVNTLPSAAEVKHFFRAVEDTLSPQGRLVMRVYCQPDRKISEDDLVRGIESRDIGYHALRLRIGMYLAQREGAFVPVHNIAATFDALFPDRDRFVERCKAMTWDHFALIDAYKKSEDFWYVPSPEMLFDELAAVCADAQFVNSGSYPFAQDCPILVLQHR
jgi:hypothetical protein